MRYQFSKLFFSYLIHEEGLTLLERAGAVQRREGYEVV